MENKVRVLIVGAGPTGLTMARLLHEFKVPFRIIDEAIKPVQTSNSLVVQTRTLEMFDDIAPRILKKMFEEGYELKGFSFFSFNQLLIEITTHHLLSLYPFVLALAQSDTEKILIEDLEKENINIEMEVELIGLTEKQNTVEVHLKHKDAAQESFEVDWIIACDGCNSTLRQSLHVPFPERDLSSHFVMGDIKLTHPFKKNELLAFFSPKGSFFIAPFETDKARIIFDVTHDPTLKSKKKPTQEELIQLFKDRCHLDIHIEEVLWTSGFWIHESIISQYKVDRVFFLGDAAHLHSPAGGQGLNMGVQDSYNLAWKLAQVIYGNSPLSLLDTYHEERRPVAEKILLRSRLLTEMMTVKNKFFYYLRNYMMRFMLRTRVQDKFFTVLTQLAINYRHSSITKECQKKLPGPKAGDRFLDGWIDQTHSDRLLNHIRGPKPSLLFFSGILRNSSLNKLIEIKTTLMNRYKDRFHYVFIKVTQDKIETENIDEVNDIEQTIHRLYQVEVPTIYFIRPDKYIGFRGHLKDQNALITYLNRLYI